MRSTKLGRGGSASAASILARIERPWLRAKSAAMPTIFSPGWASITACWAWMIHLSSLKAISVWRCISAVTDGSSSRKLLATVQK